MLRVALVGLVMTWGVSLTRLVHSWRIPASVPVGLRRHPQWRGAVHRARG
jgi:hypothetical protein